VWQVVSQRYNYRPLSHLSQLSSRLRSHLGRRPKPQSTCKRCLDSLKMPGQGTVVGLPKTVRTARLRPKLQFERISTKPLHRHQSRRHHSHQLIATPAVDHVNLKGMRSLSSKSKNSQLLSVARKQSLLSPAPRDEMAFELSGLSAIHFMPGEFQKAQFVIERRLVSRATANSSVWRNSLPLTDSGLGQICAHLGPTICRSLPGSDLSTSTDRMT
jgi:hypothetical protein